MTCSATNDQYFGVSLTPERNQSIIVAGHTR